MSESAQMFITSPPADQYLRKSEHFPSHTKLAYVEWEYDNY